jgi:hypothetical protein
MRGVCTLIYDIMPGQLFRLTLPDKISRVTPFSFLKQ